MTYELRKKLKDAGYLFNRKYACKVCGYCPTNNATWCDLGCGSDYNEMIDIGDKPTLSELITECRVEFDLRCYPSTKYDTRYFVVERIGEDDMERQNTPEEAVAKLWLALQKK